MKILIVLALLATRLLAASASDNFNRTDLGADWDTVGIGTYYSMQIVNSEYLAPTAGAGKNYGNFYIGIDSADVQTVSAKIYYASAVSRAYVIARCKPDSRTFYYFGLNTSAAVRIGKYVNGTNTQIGTTINVSAPSGSTIGLYISHDTLIGYVNGVTVATVTDSDITGSGYGGVFTYVTEGEEPSFDDFEILDNNGSAPACDDTISISAIDSTATQLFVRTITGCESDMVGVLYGADTASLDTIYHFDVGASDTILDTVNGLTSSTKYYFAVFDTGYRSEVDSVFTADSVDTIILCLSPVIDLSSTLSTYSDSPVNGYGFEFKATGLTTYLDGNEQTITAQTDTTFSVTFDGAKVGTCDFWVVDSCGNSSDTLRVTINSSETQIAAINSIRPTPWYRLRPIDIYGFNFGTQDTVWFGWLPVTIFDLWSDNHITVDQPDTFGVFQIRVKEATKQHRLLKPRSR